MKSGRYTLKELLVNKQIEQIIVPEIQRDYVWPKEQTESFIFSIKREFEVFITAAVPLESPDAEVSKLFTIFYKKQRCSCNIGFIYAYNDPEYIGKYFLIDGQQRLTTLYLLLLALAVKGDAQQRKDFEKYLFPDKQLKIDYKVREAAHDFLQNFFGYILGGKSINDVAAQHWYFTDYDLDITIQFVISNYRTIDSFITEKAPDFKLFYDYVLDYTECWYFDTSISEQGEELYIYMNARGEQIQGNEKQKADALSKLTEADLANVRQRSDYNEDRTVEGLKKYWGKKWEDWQDFFWQNRNKNENADKGFNDFLKCIQGLENYLASANKYVKPKVTSICNLEQTEIYIDALKFLLVKKDCFKANYQYSRWVDVCLETIWGVTNESDTDWLANFTDNDRSKERRRMVLLWPFLYYYRQKKSDTTPDEIFRLLRIFYLRYFNNNRSVTNIKPLVDSLLQHQVLNFMGSSLVYRVQAGAGETDNKIITAEESIKYKFLFTKTDDLRQYESAIWEIEGHPLNRNGEDLGNINITHIVSFDENPTLQTLQLIKERFRKIFPTDKPADGKLMQTLLLHYGKYWQKVTPNNYQNYQFDNWGRIIRNIDGTDKAFEKFFKEYCALPADTQFNLILKKKCKEVLDTNVEELFRARDLRSRLIVYSMLIGDIWYYGNFIGIENYTTISGLFDNEPPNSNKGRDFRSSYKYLYLMFGGNKAAAVDKLNTIKTALQQELNPTT